ncbi:MAG: helix-turn-helix domain-containing protein, partial [Lachnospiraceae bacterium]|nr:helix-turn-helix domain-containing protein [Lachnospiraceae bacterium]
MILADKILYERKKNGYSQEDLADKLGVTRQAISKWEGAQSTPDLQ